MSDFIVALGLVFVIEGLVFSAFPATAKRAMELVQQTQDGSLRIVGLVVGRPWNSIDLGNPGLNRRQSRNPVPGSLTRS